MQQNVAQQPISVNVVQTSGQQPISVKLQDIAIKDSIGETLEDLSAWISQKLESERQALVSRLKAELSTGLSQNSALAVEDLKQWMKTHGSQGSAKQSKWAQLPGGGQRKEAAKVVQLASAASAPSGPEDSAGLAPKRLSAARKNSFVRKMMTGQSSIALAPPPGQRGLIGRIVFSSRFECISVSLILLNTLLMALEVQYTGAELGYKMDYDGYSKHPSTTHPWAALP
jgi:hypothetical protein